METSGVQGPGGSKTYDFCNTGWTGVGKPFCFTAETLSFAIKSHLKHCGRLDTMRLPVNGADENQ